MQTLNKIIAAKKALDFIDDDSIVGLGSGSTAELFIEFLGKKIKKEKLKIIGIPTSTKSKNLAARIGIRILYPNDVDRIDIAVDGTDEIDAKGYMIKGRGGALFREKIIDYFAKKLIIVADESKLVNTLGEKHALPIEVSKFAYKIAQNKLKTIYKVKSELRTSDGSQFITDNGNFILDANFRKIKNPVRLEKELNTIPGVIENGIFTRKPEVIIIGYEDKAKILRSN